MMHKKQVNTKRDVLKRMQPKDLVDHICKYPNQDFLNFDENGKRDIPVGAIAQNVQSHNYEMSDAQYYTMIHHFAKITVPDVKVVGITFYKNDPSQFARNQISDNGKGHQIYEVDFILTPEPTNQFDVNAVSVNVRGADIADGVQEYHHIGYLPADFVAIHPIGEETEVHGIMKDVSNGKLKSVSYTLPLDLEVINTNNTKMLNADLEHAEQLALDVGDNDVTLSEADLDGLMADISMEM